MDISTCLLDMINAHSTLVRLRVKIYLPAISLMMFQFQKGTIKSLFNNRVQTE